MSDSIKKLFDEYFEEQNMRADEAWERRLVSKPYTASAQYLLEIGKPPFRLAVYPRDLGEQ